MRLTNRERALLRSALEYVAEVPSLEWLETLSPADERALSRLVEKIRAWPGRAPFADKRDEPQ